MLFNTDPIVTFSVDQEASANWRPNLSNVPFFTALRLDPCFTVNPKIRARAITFILAAKRWFVLFAGQKFLTILQLALMELSIHPCKGIQVSLT